MARHGREAALPARTIEKLDQSAKPPQSAAAVDGAFGWSENNGRELKHADGGALTGRSPMLLPTIGHPVIAPMRSRSTLQGARTTGI